MAGAKSEECMHFLEAPLVSPRRRDSARPARSTPVPFSWHPRDVLLTLECPRVVHESLSFFPSFSFMPSRVIKYPRINLIFPIDRDFRPEDNFRSCLIYEVVPP